MGLFGKLKNILFEDEDEIDDMPVYTKEEVEEEEEVQTTIEPTIVSTPSKLPSIKRDIDVNFEEEDVLSEIPGAVDSVSQVKQEEKAEEVKPVEEKKSIFPSFDEAEFERLNARINHNESKATQRELVKRVDIPANDMNSVNVRQANNNFSATTVTENRKDSDRYKINSGTIVNGKKPFTPSPVISPVYGILDKNYTKDDIVDRKGGLKREKSVKPLKKEQTIEEAEKNYLEEDVAISIDSIRKKAYGEDIDLPKVTEKEIEEELTTKPSEEVYREVIEEVEPEETQEVENAVEVPEVQSIEEQIEDESFEVTSEDELDSVIEEVVPDDKKEKIETKKMKVLDDLEKTSTLKILDDIEKELNSIKPISKEDEEEEDAIVKEHEKSLDDTLENDLFNLIDSMYEEGDEEDD